MSDAIEEAADPARLLEWRIVCRLQQGPARYGQLLVLKPLYGSPTVHSTLQKMRKRGVIEWVDGKWRLK